MLYCYRQKVSETFRRFFLFDERGREAGAIAAGKYRDWLTPDGLKRLEQWAREGLTDDQIAQKIGVSRGRFYEWLKKYDDIRDAIKKGKAPVDIDVENALLKRALGYEYEEVTTETEEYPTGKVDEDGRMIMRERTRRKTVTKMVLPDVTAQIYWLNNRRPDRWRNKPAPDSSDTLDRLDTLMEEMRRAAYTETG